MPQLICEGSCNGGRTQEFAQMIAKAGRTATIANDVDAITTTGLSAEQVAFGRTLKHVPHHYVGQRRVENYQGEETAILERFACDVCGQERDYGHA